MATVLGCAPVIDFRRAVAYAQTVAQAVTDVVPPRTSPVAPAEVQTAERDDTALYAAYLWPCPQCFEQASWLPYRVTPGDSTRYSIDCDRCGESDAA